MKYLPRVEGAPLFPTGNCGPWKRNCQTFVLLSLMSLSWSLMNQSIDTDPTLLQICWEKSKIFSFFKLRGMDSLSRDTTLTEFLPLFYKGVCSKMKESAPMGSRFFHFRVDPFSEGAWCEDSKLEVTKVVSLVKKAENLLGIFSHLKMALNLINHVFLNLDIPCLCKQCSSRSVGLIWICTVCH